MPEREIQEVASLQKWRGVDQRTQPTLVQDGFFTWSKGLIFGIGTNIERIPGKRLTLLFGQPVLSITQFGQFALVQTQTELLRVPVADLALRTTILPFGTPGDIAGAAYWRATLANTVPWTNPHTAGRVTVMFSGYDGGTEPDLVDRATNNTNTNNAANSFMGIDFGAGFALKVDTYTLRNRQSFATDNIRNWKLQGTNTVAGITAADWVAAAWTDLDVRVADTEMASVNQWITRTLTLTPVAYRYLRILQTGLNSSGGNHLCLAEFEFYGRMVFAS